MVTAMVTVREEAEKAEAPPPAPRAMAEGIQEMALAEAIPETATEMVL
jgi:hypothetical protein